MDWVDLGGRKRRFHLVFVGLKGGSAVFISWGRFEFLCKKLCYAILLSSITEPWEIICAGPGWYVLALIRLILSHTTLVAILLWSVETKLIQEFRLTLLMIRHVCALSFLKSIKESCNFLRLQTLKAVLLFRNASAFLVLIWFFQLHLQNTLWTRVSI